MVKNKASLTLLFLFIWNVSYASVNQNADMQVWTSGSVTKRFTYNIDATAYTEFRFGDDVSQLFFKLGQVQLSYAPYSFLILSPGYRQMATRLARPGQWSSICAPMLDITLQANFLNCVFLNRNRVQYNFREVGQNNYEYRERFVLRYKPQKTFKKFTPYLSEELFFYQRDGFTQNRFMAGITYNLNKYAKPTLYYMLRNAKRNKHWPHQNVWGFDLSIAF